MCHSEGEWTTYLSALEQGMVVDARCTGLSVSRAAMLLGFSCSTLSRVYQWSTTQRTSSQLNTTVGSIGVNMGQHPCGTLSKRCRVHRQQTEAAQKGVILNIRIDRPLFSPNIDVYDWFRFGYFPSNSQEAKTRDLYIMMRCSCLRPNNGSRCPKGRKAGNKLRST